jgi:hypothetical protein
MRKTIDKKPRRGALVMKAFMPKVMICGVDSCTFNQNGKCRAAGINIGGPVPECVTWYSSGRKVAEENRTGGVGACKATSCIFNQSLRCIAMGIQVKKNGNHAFCNTFDLEKSRVVIAEVYTMPARIMSLQE